MWVIFAQPQQFGGANNLFTARDGTLAAQQDRVLRDGTTTATRTWFAQTLPSINVQDVGSWSLELTIGEQVIGRYPFMVSR